MKRRTPVWIMRVDHGIAWVLVPASIAAFAVAIASLDFRAAVPNALLIWALVSLWWYQR